MTSNYDFALRGSDRPARKFNQLYVILESRAPALCFGSQQDTLDHITHRFVSFIALTNSFPSSIFSLTLCNCVNTSSQ
jgi:hypothetical protein